MTDQHPPQHTSDSNAEPGWKLRLEDRFGLLDPIQILVFRSYGTPDTLHIRGRVRERRNVEGTARDTPTWQNILNSLHRLESDEIPGAHVRAHFRGKHWDTITDHEGYFALDLDTPERLEAGWHEVNLELVQSVGEPASRFVTEQVLIPSPDAEFAVISDLDDTVIKTRSAELLQMLAIVFSEGAHDRVVFPGIPAFYRALSRGPDDQGGNPIFYVSKSGWNLYDLFEEFMDVNDIPIGPLFLSDLRFIEDKSPVMGNGQHKWDSIDLLLRTYPELPFILIGDSGMHDPELYRRVVREHPGRIRAIYIHDVSPDKRDREVQEIAEEMGAKGIPMLRAEQALEAAEHAARQGYISQRSLEEVRREVQRQQARGSNPES